MARQRLRRRQVDEVELDSPPAGRWRSAPASGVCAPDDGASWPGGRRARRAHHADAPETGRTGTATWLTAVTGRNRRALSPSRRDRPERGRSRMKCENSNPANVLRLTRFGKTVTARVTYRRMPDAPRPSRSIRTRSDADGGSAPGTVSLPEVHGTVPVPSTGGLLAQDDGVCRARLPGRRRLHGSGQLGDRSRRRRALRLHADQRDHAVQPDGDPAAGALGAPRHRQRPRSRAGVPRSLLAAGHLRAVAALRDRDRGVRSRRGDRLGDRAQPALRPAAVLGRLLHRARRAARALPAAVPLPLRRGAGGAADPRHRRLVRDRAGAGAARPRRRCCGRSCPIRRSPATPRCCSSPSASSARR